MWFAYLPAMFLSHEHDRMTVIGEIKQSPCHGHFWTISPAELVLVGV